MSESFRGLWVSKTGGDEKQHHYKHLTHLRVPQTGFAPGPPATWHWEAFLETSALVVLEIEC